MLRLLLLNFIKLFPLFGALLVLMGILKVSIYYWFFDIPILTFLDFPELLLQFLEGSLAYSFIISLALFSGVLLGKKHNKSLELKENETEEAYQNRIKRIEWNRNEWINTIIVFVSFVFIMSIWNVCKQFPFKIAWKFILVNLFIIVYLLCSVKLRRSIINYWRSENLPHHEIAEGITFLLFFLFALLSITSIKALTRKYSEHPTFSAQFKDQRQITSNDTLIYLGQTRNYVFFYNRNADRKYVYPTSELSEIKY